MTAADDPTLDVLVRHRAFVRGIARALLVDPDAAEDVVQQTWLAAMKHVARGGEVGRSLLARIARNLAFNRRREGRRREAREHHASVHELLPSPSEIIETEDERRRVVDAVLALDEPFRSTVLLRYMKEHSEAEVARELGVPLETVRWRLKTARARLRVRLGGETDAPQSARALLALADWSVKDATAALAAAKGSAVLGAKIWVGAAVGISAVTLIGWQLLGDGAAPRAGTDAEIAVVESDAHDASRERAEVAQRAPIDSAELEHAAASSAPAAAPPRTATILGRCVTQQDAAVVGATVSSPLAAAVTVTGKDGRFAIEVDATSKNSATNAVTAELSFGAEHSATTLRRTSVVPGAAVELGDIELAMAGAIHGVVLDEADRPLAATIHIAAGAFATEPWWTYDSTQDANVASVRANAAGAFDVGALEDAWYSIVPELRGFTTEGAVPVAVTRGNVSDVVVHMRAAPSAQRVDLVVVDDADKPMPGIAVEWASLWHSAFGDGVSHRRLVTDAAGECSLVVADGSTHSFDVLFGDGRSASVRAVRAGAPRVVLRREAAPLATIAVVDDTTGAACAGVVVLFVEQTDDDFQFEGPGRRRYGRTDASGTAHVPVPPGRFALQVSDIAHETYTAGAFDGGRAPVLDPIRLRPELSLTGTVAHEGVPAVGALVVLCVPADPALVTARSTVATNYVIATARTRSDGSFAIPLGAMARSKTKLVVRADVPGFASSCVEVHADDFDDFAPAGSPPTRMVHLNLTEGGAIEGRVTSSAVRPAAGLVVTAVSTERELVSAYVAANGTYRFEHLRPGRWMLRVSDAEIAPTTRISDLPAIAAPECQVHEGQTVRQDLAWAEAVTTRIAGLARFGGIGRFGTHVMLSPTHASADVGAVSRDNVRVIADVARDGAFRGRADAPGEYVFAVHVDDGSLVMDARRRVDLAPGPNALTFDPPCGAVAGKFAHPYNGTVTLHGELADGTVVSIRAVCAPNGSFAMLFVPVGRYSIDGASKSKEIDVRAGETLTVELP